MDHIDSVEPDKWQIGIACSLVKHGIDCIVDLLMREGLVTTGSDDAKKAFKSLPRRAREDILMELSHNAFRGGMINDGTDDATTNTICTVAAIYLARVFDAHNECSKGSDRMLKERFTKKELKAMEGERKVAMKAFEEARKEFNTSRGFKN
jgi:DNA-binding transcriptional ArsR family regulator